MKTMKHNVFGKEISEMKEQSGTTLLILLWLCIFLITGVQPAQSHEAVVADVDEQISEEMDDIGIDNMAEVEPHSLGGVLDLDPTKIAQRRPDVAWNASCDKFLTVYERKVSAVDYEIWGRYISGTGLVLGAGPFNLTNDLQTQQAPAIAYNQFGGNYLVVWQDNRDGNWEIYAQLWDCKKQPVNVAVNLTNDLRQQKAPDVICGYISAGAPQSVCWVVWEDFRDGNWNIYGQRLDGTGALIGGNIPLTINGGIQRAPAITRNLESTGCNPDGTFMVVWHDNRNAAKGYGYDIFDQQLDNMGMCGLNRPAYAGLGDQMYPDIAYGTENDRYQAVWEDNRSGNRRIHARLLTPAGIGDGLSFALDVAVEIDQSRPAIAYDMNTNNEFVTVWYDPLVTGTNDIKGRRTSGLGALLTGGVLSATANSEMNPAIAFGSASDSFFTVWEDSGIGIQGRAISP
jgi:hypothetical protein